MATEAKLKANRKYLKEKVDAFRIYFPKGQKEIAKEFAKSRGKSLNAFVLELINNAIETADNPQINK